MKEIGRVAERLGTGLQNPLLRFKSGRDLKFKRRGGEIGIHKGLKIPRTYNPCEFESRPRHKINL